LRPPGRRVGRVNHHWEHPRAAARPSLSFFHSSSAPTTIATKEVLVPSSAASAHALLLRVRFCMMAFTSAHAVGPGDAAQVPSMQLREKAHLMTASEIERTLVRLAHEMVEKTEGLPELVLVGIRRRGVHLAERLARKIREISSAAVPVGTLDIQFYRDDLSKVDTKPVVIPTQIPFPVSDKDVILVDDVIYTGRTSRAAMDALFDHGRPRRVRLCVLIDRGHRELPIEAAFVGKRVPTDPREVIEVKLQEEDQMEKVLMLEQINGESNRAGRSRSQG